MKTIGDRVIIESAVSKVSDGYNFNKDKVNNRDDVLEWNTSYRSLPDKKNRPLQFVDC